MNGRTWTCIFELLSLPFSICDNILTSISILSTYKSKRRKKNEKEYSLMKIASNQIRRILEKNEEKRKGNES